MVKKPAPNPLPPRIIRLLRESSGLALFGIALYLVLIFYGYDRADPAWSHSGGSTQVHNAGGRMGAWLVDLLLSLFGVSAWWWVLLFLYLASWNYRRIDVVGIFDRRPLFVSAAGFLALLATSSAFEALRFYTLGSAWFSFDEKKRGSLEVGKYADLAVLSKDYMTVPVDEVHTIESVLTMVGGKIVYETRP